MKRIPLTQGQFALVDDSDFKSLSRFKWCAHRGDRGVGRYYALRGIGVGGKTKIIRMHRQLLDATAGTEVDHIDGNSLNNQRSNLRICSHRENIRNLRGPRNTGSNGFRGVHFYKRVGKWTAQITVDGKKIHLGYFAAESDAAKAYSEANRKHFGEFGGQLVKEITE